MDQKQIIDDQPLASKTVLQLPNIHSQQPEEAKGEKRRRDI
jgi:hypothetical protein